MIVSWMLSALLFGACMVLVAASAERLARAAGAPGRWIWGGALIVAAGWPLCWPLVARVLPQLHTVAAALPAVRVLPDGAALTANASRDALDVAGRAFVTLWTLASLLLATRLVRAVRTLRRLRAEAECRMLDGMPVLVTDRVGPATIGLRRPSVLVPRAMLDLDEPLRGLVLRHEREHCDARDPWLLAATTLAVVLLPWNVALWSIARRLHLALELDCDARVLASGADPQRYARLLLLIAQSPRVLPLTPAFAAPPSHLERRIIAMRTRLARPRPLHLVAGGAALALGLIGACSSATPDAPPTRPTAAAASRPRVRDANAPLFEFQVEQQVRQIPGTGSLRYPTAMRLANREGEVLAQFVVDAQGIVEMATFKALKSTDPAFTEAVRTALPTMRFTPAQVGGRAVKQLVQQPFTFGLSGS
jgi:TonB family protein